MASGFPAVQLRDNQFEDEPYLSQQCPTLVMRLARREPEGPAGAFVGTVMSALSLGDAIGKLPVALLRYRTQVLCVVKLRTQHPGWISGTRVFCMGPIQRSICSCEVFGDNFALVRRLRHRNIPNASTTAESRDKVVARAMRIEREVFNDPDDDDVEGACDDGDDGDENGEDIFGDTGEEFGAVPIGAAMGSQCINIPYSARSLEFNSPDTGMLNTITVVKVTSKAS
ncbi:hypothetical protein V8D89_004152 [Ganoderma adspersum]